MTATMAGRGEEWSEVVAAPALGGLQAVHARFRTHEFPLHAHAEYVIGAVVSGAKASRRGSRVFEARAGMLTLFHPFEAHASWGLGAAWRFAGVYPDAALMDAWFDAAPSRRASFRSPVVHDPEGAAALLGLHARLAAARDPLAAQSAFVETTGALMRRHAGLKDTSTDAGAAVVARLRERLDADLAEPLGLDALAKLSGLTPVAVLRAFRRAVGCTPHLYRTARRVAAAKRALAAGSPPADVAQATGFCDQSHLTRVFRRWTGATPGAFAKRG